MKPEGAFIAERSAAQHCAELVRSAAPPPGELLAALGPCTARFAKALAPRLAPLCGGEAPDIAPDRPDESTAEKLTSGSRSLAAHCLLHAGAGAAALPLLVTIEGAAVLEMLDRAFGGPGEAPASLPPQFPASAHLLLSRIEGLVAAALSEAFPQAGPIAPRRSHSDLAELGAFAAGAALVTVGFDVSQGTKLPWTLRLALPQAALAALLGVSPVPAPRPPRAADPAAAPFAAVPLCLSAVLVDMAVPMGRISALEPGQVLPIAVARSVPLRIGEQTLAHGAVGTEDDRVAIQITHLA